ncbi:MAG TPA: alanine--glyoxylate aminotransferase family protein [Desulfohalobiaceae bacterium]|nr:alanine--glyoxylate aminotransferase family protein [Desulfohalobiaceae bacterium]
MHNKLRLLTPGPTPIPEQVRLALAQDMIHHRKSKFQSILNEIQLNLQHLFNTNQPVLPLSCSGTGAMDAAVSNLFSTGETVIVVEGGKFGQRWRQIAETYGIEVISVQVPPGESVQPQEIEDILSQNKHISGILIQASETSTGVLHPIREIAQLTQDENILLVVDGISAIGISPCPMDKWGLDCLLTGSQKGIMLPPGLALIALSEKAWQKAEQVNPKNFYFNLLQEKQKNKQGQTLFTSPVNLIMGLKTSLELFFEQDLKQIYQKYWAMTRMTRTGVQTMGLDLLVNSDFTWGLTSISLPQQIDGQSIASYANKHFNVVMAGGQGDLKGKIIRIGHMGYVDWADILAGLYALRESAQACGCQLPDKKDYLEQAMTAYQQAWQEQPKLMRAG